MLRQFTCVSQSPAYPGLPGEQSVLSQHLYLLPSGATRIWGAGVPAGVGDGSVTAAALPPSAVL